MRTATLAATITTTAGIPAAGIASIGDFSAAMPQRYDLIEQIIAYRLTAPCGLSGISRYQEFLIMRGFTTHREANTPSEASAELMAYAD